MRQAFERLQFTPVMAEQIDVASVECDCEHQSHFGEGIDYLLTWNLRHLANAALENRIRWTRIACGYRPPVICTPEELG